MNKSKETMLLSDLKNIAHIVKPKTHVLLLSHMRSYSSLFGHLIGEHKAVDGYYEMHIGYYSKRSLIRQKVLYYRDNLAKPNAGYMFDKVLHNEHEINSRMLNLLGDNILISLRHPSTAVPSIQEYYSNKYPENELAIFSNAEQYYKQRLKSLEEYSRKIKGRYFYFDAETIINAPNSLLKELQEYLKLASPIPTTYNKRANTGTNNTGDTSASIKEGKIMPEVSRTTSNEIQNSTFELYEDVRKTLCCNSQVMVKNSESN